MPGPLPKRADQRRNRRKVSTSTELVPLTGKVPVPKLPPSSLDQGWHPRAAEAWDSWWQSPMRQEWQDTDHQNLLMLVDLVNIFHYAHPGDVRGKAELMAQIRLMMREMGLTPMSRRTLQWTVLKVDEEMHKAVSRRTPARAKKKDPRDQYVIDAEVVD